MTLRIAVDIGGTFTDGLAQDSETGELRIAKHLTTPSDPGIAVSEVVRNLLLQTSTQGQHVDEVVHATTLVTNAVIEARGGRAAMIMTSGTADTLQLRREDRYDMYDLDIVFTPPLIPRDAIFEINARVDACGTEVQDIEPGALAGLLDELAVYHPESIAVCLLHAYANSTHERELRTAIEQRFPDIKISLSSQVAPEIREFERASTVATNAYVQPLTAAYLANLIGRLKSDGVSAPLRVMTSSGGFTSSKIASEVPVKLLESGPAAGVLSATATGMRNGIDNILAFDMGGTTAKACVVVNGAPEITSVFEAGRAKRFAKGSGLPIIAPSIDLIEIGAGGGSIARCSVLELLNVGPESAGSDPGPACYALGGTQPTVTDADLILGYLDKDAFLGGTMTLDRRAAETAIATLANELATDPQRLAVGICSLVNENMAAAARVHIAEKGHDPRAFTLVATGGAGPVHAVEVAYKLGIRRVLCSVAVGVGSCLGLLAAPPRVDQMWTRVERLQEIDWDRFEQEHARSKEQAQQEFASTGTNLDDVRWSLSADMRFTGQSDTISVPVPHSDITGDVTALIEAAFEEEYTRLFGSVLDGETEVVTWRLSGEAPGQNFETTQIKSSSMPSPVGRRAVYITDLERVSEVPVYSRYDLSAGNQFDGPAVIQETESTIVVARTAAIHVLPDLTISIDIPSSEPS